MHINVKHFCTCYYISKFLEKQVAGKTFFMLANLLKMIYSFGNSHSNNASYGIRAAKTYTYYSLRL